MPDRKSSTSRTLAIKIIAPILLLVMSTVFGVILVELLYIKLAPSKQFNLDQYIAFFGGSGTIVENRNDIWTYSPNKDIRRMDVYFNDDDFVIEYDYRFHTNNFGLVQDADIVPNVNSMLFLGDSFTEGQGAEPWFRHVAGEISNLGYQPINGGLTATGFAQWSRLENYLASKSIRIQKIVVLFISDDYIRGIWNFSDQTLQCLSGSNCRGEGGYFPLPPMEELSSRVSRIQDTRRWALMRGQIKNVLPASYRVYDFVRTLVTPGVHSALNVQQSDAAIAALIKKYGTVNVTFIHLPEKNEVDEPHGFGLSARRSIENAGGRVYDGFKLCGLTPPDYNVHDPHPNKNGYAKIALCTSRIIKQQDGLP
jgi:hypothetical protein